jgi:hypothetical protein
MTIDPVFGTLNRQLPKPVAICYATITLAAQTTLSLANDFWWHDARPWLAVTLTRWGKRLT